MLLPLWGAELARAWACPRRRCCHCQVEDAASRCRKCCRVHSAPLSMLGHALDISEPDRGWRPMQAAASRPGPRRPRAIGGPPCRRVHLGVRMTLPRFATPRHVPQEAGMVPCATLAITRAMMAHSNGVCTTRFASCVCFDAVDQLHPIPRQLHLFTRNGRARHADHTNLVKDVVCILDERPDEAPNRQHGPDLGPQHGGQRQR